MFSPIRSDNSVAAFNEFDTHNAITVIPEPESYMSSFPVGKGNPSNSFQSPYNQPNIIFKRTVLGFPEKTESASWIQNYSSKELVSPLTLAMKPITDKVIKIALLREGWDSYNAQRISWMTLTRLLDFFAKMLFDLESRNKEILENIPIPFIAPLSDGGVQVEWNTLYKEIIFEMPPDAKFPIEYLKVYKANGEKEEENQVSNSDELKELIINWFLEVRR